MNDAVTAAAGTATDADRPAAVAAAAAPVAPEPEAGAGPGKGEEPAAAAAKAAAAVGDGLLLAPWLDHRGGLNRAMWQALVKRLMGVVLRNPGIPEPLLVAQMDAICPAAAERMLGMLVEQQHLIVKEIPSSAAAGGAGGGDGGADSSSSAGDERPALKLGLALSRCLSAAGPAKPPSLLLGRTRPAAAAAGVEEGVKGVRHYWPSLVSSSVCHLTALPPCRTAATAGAAAGV